jgi:hypothetical protein
MAVEMLKILAVIGLVIIAVYFGFDRIESKK